MGSGWPIIPGPDGKLAPPPYFRPGVPDPAGPEYRAAYSAQQEAHWQAKRAEWHAQPGNQRAMAFWRAKQDEAAGPPPVNGDTLRWADFIPDPEDFGIVFRAPTGATPDDVLPCKTAAAGASPTAAESDNPV